MASHKTPILALAFALLAAACSERSAPEPDALSPAGETHAPAQDTKVAAQSSAAAALPAIDETVYRLTTKTPYPTPTTAATREPPPAGYQLVMLQHVARHGSRGLSSPGDDLLSLQLWQQADSEQQLTPLGEQLGPLLQQLIDLHSRIGYGAVSALGRREHRELAARLVTLHGDFFGDAATGRALRLQHSGRSRARDSGYAFREGLLDALPQLAEVLTPLQAAPQTLYFYKAEGNEDYRAYRRYMQDNPQLQQVLHQLRRDPRTQATSRELLQGLYSPAFVARLAAGDYRFVAGEPGDEDVLQTPLDAALALYGLYTIASNLSEDEPLDFTPFITEQQAAWLGYIDDAESFYERGPGFAGQDVTYRGAGILVQDMVARIDGLISAEHTDAADLRFTHAQVLIPLATYLGFADASQAASIDTAYHYANNPWRGARVAPMAANIIWEVYRNTDGEVLIRQLRNEQQVPFKEGCERHPDSLYFYPWRALKDCYGW